MEPQRVFIGWDPAQMAAWNVAQQSASSKTTIPLLINRLALAPLVRSGLYTRPTRYPSDDLDRVGYWDEISNAPMSTGHAISRFFVPLLNQYRGWALFTDGDVLFRRDLKDLFALADDRYAVMVVKHEAYDPGDAVKMEGQIQTRYERKNWSSVMLWNCAHKANVVNLPPLLNVVPGRDLHRFCWLRDEEIGTLPAEWNVLIGHSDLAPALAHFTDGVPNMPGYEHVPYADEWYAVAKACGYQFKRPPRPVEGVA